MRRVSVAVGLLLALALSGCVSAERKAEYAAWKSSDDGIANVTLETFEARYQQGWRERAQAKRTERLEHAEYLRWLKSDDGVKDTSYEVFKAKYKSGWRERAEQKKQTRLAKERLKRKLEFSEKEWTDKINASMSNQLSQVRCRVTKGQKWFFSPLKEPVTFLDESDSDLMAGESLLSDFGMKFLPNAYADYEKKREAAFELEQVFNETFPKAWTIKNGDSQWEAMHKVLEKYVRLREEYRWSRDALAYYWYLQKLGVMNSSDLAKVDTAKLMPRLLPFQQNVGVLEKALEEMNRYFAKGKYMYLGTLKSKADNVAFVAMMDGDRTFAAKYAPEAYAIFQTLEQAHKEGAALLEECLKARMQMDNGRYSEALVMQEEKQDEIAKKMNEIARALKAWRTGLRTTLKSSEDVAKCDQELAKKVKPFVTALPDYVKTRVRGPVIPEDDMLEISNMKYRMQRTNVTQLQWMIVMGDNPVEEPFKRDPRKAVPLYGLGNGRAQEESVLKFIRCVRKMDGKKYRIPTFEMIDSLTDNKQQRTWPYRELMKVGMGDASEDGLFDLENMRDLCIHLDPEEKRRWKDLNPGLRPDNRSSPDFSGLRLCLDDGSAFWTKTEKRLYRAITQGEALFQRCKAKGYDLHNWDYEKDCLEDLRRLAVFFE